MGIKVLMPKQVHERYEKYQNAIIANPMKKHMVGNYKIIPFEVPHDADIECLAFIIDGPRIGRLLYITDCVYCKYNLSKMKLNHIICECNHINDRLCENYEDHLWKRVLSTHMDLSTVCEFLRVNQTDELRNVILCHLSADNANPDVMKSEVQTVVGDSVNVYIAKKGVEINL